MDEATFVGTTTFWIIIAAAFLAVLIVAFLIVALIKMKQRNDEIVSKVVTLEQDKLSNAPQSHLGSSPSIQAPSRPTRENDNGRNFVKQGS